MTTPTIIPIDTPTLGDRSYLVHDGEVAFVIDPQRDIDRVIDLANRERVRVTHVFETHIHNDYVTGGLALAELTGAGYFVNADDPVSYARTPVRDGDELRVGGSMRVRVLATPGHTFTHLSYALSADCRPIGVFTGGSLLYGTTGRPDLLGPRHTHDLVRAQYASAHRLAGELPDATPVFPTHGFGSFCSSTQSEATTSTIGQERRTNTVLTDSEEQYVRDLLDALDVYPAYYAHMAPANLAGPSAPDLRLPSLAQPDELRARMEAGEWVVDLRDRTAFAAGHVPGTFNFGIDGAFATYVGWLIAWGTPITLLGKSEAEVQLAQRELVRIGIDRPAAAATGTPQQWTRKPLGAFPQATFADLDAVRHHRSVVILDVRRAAEFAAARIEGAVNIPIDELPRRVQEVPAAEIWVHCAGGYRASIAASFLAAAGRALVVIDDSFDNARKTGLHLVSAEGAATVASGRRHLDASGGHGVNDASGRPGVDAVTVREAQRALEEGAVLVDVRETDEWNAGHVADAIHLPLAEVGDHLADLPADRVILVVCRSGSRSASAAALLKGRGLRAVNMSGGMIAWEASGLPIMTLSAAPSQVPPRSAVGTITVVDP